jgi:ketosteroid isomerase-like protein
MAISTSNTETVRAIYDAFGRGDVPAVLERLTEDVSWDRWPTGNSAQEHGVPWLAERRGRSEVARFFEVLGASIEFHAFEPGVVLEGERCVAALVRYDATVRATGRRFQDEELHLWELDDAGRVARLRHFLDTGKHIAAYRD